MYVYACSYIASEINVLTYVLIHNIYIPTYIRMYALTTII